MVFPTPIHLVPTPHSQHAPLNPPNQPLSTNPSILQNAINMLNLNIPSQMHQHASNGSFVSLEPSDVNYFALGDIDPGIPTTNGLSCYTR